MVILISNHPPIDRHAADGGAAEVRDCPGASCDGAGVARGRTCHAGTDLAGCRAGRDDARGQGVRENDSRVAGSPRTVKTPEHIIVAIGQGDVSVSAKDGRRADGVGNRTSSACAS